MKNKFWVFVPVNNTVVHWSLRSFKWFRALVGGMIRTEKEEGRDDSGWTQAVKDNPICRVCLKDGLWTDMSLSELLTTDDQENVKLIDVCRRSFGKGTNPSGGRWIIVVGTGDPSIDGVKIWEEGVTNSPGIPVSTGRTKEYEVLTEILGEDPISWSRNQEIDEEENRKHHNRLWVFVSKENPNGTMKLNIDVKNRPEGFTYYGDREYDDRSPYQKQKAEQDCGIWLENLRKELSKKVTE